MLKVRKIFRRYVYTIALLFVGCFLLIHYFSEPSEYLDSKFKINVIEESIRSNQNYGTCKIPKLPIDNPEIMKFYKKDPIIDCGTKEDDWVYCKKSTCLISKWVVAEKGNVTCYFTDLIRKSDYKVKYGRTTRTSSSYTLVASDFAKATCKARNGDRWFGIVYGIRNIPSLHRSKKYAQPLLNVLMFGFDSLSRNAFIRKLPKTYEYLVNRLHAHILQGYNIVGDGTPQALIPILTGRTELELPETRKRMRNSNFVDLYPMIWKDYKKSGYMTSFNEDLPKVGTFTYRLNGFEEQPTDHYMRTYYLEIENYLSNFQKFCHGSQPAHRAMLDYTKNFMLKYNGTYPKFVFSFHGELSHDSINLIGAADEDMTNWLMDLKRSGVLNNTILIMMSDHGNRFAEVRNTLQGKQEERLPFFSFTFPSWFRSRYPTQYNNFAANVDRLTTPFDIHETLMDILRIQHVENPSQKEVKSRAISLFDEVPKERSCADAYIEPHWCTCLNWEQINDTTSTIVVRVANSVIDTINTYTSQHRNICEKLTLHEINWAMRMVPNTGLLRFRGNKDMDGFLADLTSQTKVETEMYQVKITVLPGYSLFEASVTYNLAKNEFRVNMSDISRINKYGSQANCIYDTLPELRKYCFCKAQL
ncbi:unnamed protein product [Hermetia illucens]|uniref:DUF229 domain containing protein n=1 Tax=Hermetia illucens TaxID=343691 RepID=A0A7R8Z0E1_HERIL|nr:uncharacterized protein LOC119659486 [Hermetia illucens]XP_037923528.1 uncharacterized protein LOC119659486 [Hermetia illucens]CAD7092544.1 unnamed protein product [Hermetia illucens]